ncbi:phosphopantetheine-binding protein [Millisia brevis]|uniref:phosphopantetheine-binding protein n=1 Tax=Millisia brevis TaxID=264148 RepID=UPI000831928F|nr:phosphopantetheine-binding protein [Millisia brevis]
MTEAARAASAEQIVADIARILDIDVRELDAAADLTDHGLDSLRLMALVEKWQADGFDVDFVSLASAPILERWISSLVSSAGDDR